ncbi:hypothetical protein MCOR25_003101 [Pyricularia grisea]|nr:hypothetical protein MCOR25_003101 [Pyricularia grisea]
MEVVVSSRDDGASEVMKEWTEDEEVTRIRRMQSGEWMGSSPRKPTHDRMRSEASSAHMRQFQSEKAKGRQTVNWPFASVTSETTTVISTPVMPDFPLRRRRQTWQTPGIRDSDIFSVDGSIVPDYVRNYIRGETPESLAMKRKNNGRLAERDVEYNEDGTGHNRMQSRAGELGGFGADDGGHSTIGSDMSGDDRRHLMRGAGGDSRGNRESWGSLAGGWRAGVSVNLLIAFIIFAGSLSCFLVALAGSSSAKELLTNEANIFNGSCGEASSVSYGLHALVNVLGLVGIAGANYVFQVLTSPTRAEVDAAHAKKQWLDIGIPSVRNLGRIAPMRSVMALVLVLVAVTSQVIYNSLIFTSQAGVGYNLVYVTESFLTGAPFSNATSNNTGRLGRLDILSLQDLANRNQLVNMTTSECISRFSGNFETEFSDALFVTRLNDQSNSLVQTASPASSVKFAVNPVAAKAVTADSTPIKSDSIMFCLAKRETSDSQSCSVALNGSLLMVVVLLNLLTMVVTALVLFRTSKVSKPLVTLGDSLSSFLQVPDETTQDSCLMSKKDVLQKRWGLREIKYWVPAAQYWFQSASLTRWVIICFIWTAMTGLTASALAINLSRKTNSSTDRALTGLGTASATAAFALNVPAVGACLIAALPQLLLAVLYLATNSLLTTFYLSYESALYACGSPRPLRVSYQPQGDQTTSLFLTLPRPLSWGLCAGFAGMGFLLSQSVFVMGAQLNSATDGDSMTASSEMVCLGLSDTGLLALLAVVVVLGAGVLGMSLRRAPGATTADGQAQGNPLVLEAGSCSAVISARCHNTEPDEPSDMAARKLMWGVVSPLFRNGMEVAHCAYSSRGVERLGMSTGYA